MKSVSSVANNDTGCNVNAYNIFKNQIEPSETHYANSSMDFRYFYSATSAKIGSEVFYYFVYSSIKNPTHYLTKESLPNAIHKAISFSYIYSIFNKGEKLFATIGNAPYGFQIYDFDLNLLSQISLGYVIEDMVYSLAFEMDTGFTYGATYDGRIHKFDQNFEIINSLTLGKTRFYSFKLYGGFLYTADRQNIYKIDKNSYEIVETTTSVCINDDISRIDVDSNGYFMYACWATGYYMITSSETLYYNLSGKIFKHVELGVNGKLMLTVDDKFLLFY